MVEFCGAKPNITVPNAKRIYALYHVSRSIMKGKTMKRQILHPAMMAIVNLTHVPPAGVAIVAVAELARGSIPKMNPFESVKCCRCFENYLLLNQQQWLQEIKKNCCL